MTSLGRSSPLGLLTGWLLDAGLGDPRRFHPVAGFGQLAAALERRVYRDERLRGVLFTAALVALPAAATAALTRVVPRSALQAVLLWTALGGASLATEARAVAAAVADGDLPDARRRLPALVGRDPTGLDGGEVCRAAVESVAENTADAVVASLLYAVVAGPAGVVAHRCANTLDAMVGHRSPRYARFGWAAARLDDLLGWAPARLTALLALLLAPLVGGSPGTAARIVARDGRRHPSPNAGVAEAAFAGALGVGLGGVNRYGDRVERRGPLGDGRPPAPADVLRAVRLSRAVGAATLLMALALRLPPRAVRRWRPSRATTAHTAQDGDGRRRRRRRR